MAKWVKSDSFDTFGANGWHPTAVVLFALQRCFGCSVWVAGFSPTATYLF